MKPAHVLACLCLWCHVAVAQQRLTDSLQRVLAQPIADTTRVLVLDRLARSLMYAQPLVAMQHAQEGLRLARQAGYPYGEARIQNRIGTIFRLTGNYDRSLAAHLTAIQIAEPTHDIDALARIYTNMGNLYVEKNEWPEAIDCFRKARTFGEQLGNNDLIQTALLNLGHNYLSENQLDSALKYTQVAYAMAVRMKNADLQTELLNLGNVNAQLNRDQRALTYYRQSMPYGLTMQNNWLLSQTYLEMAKVFQHLNQRDSALYYATQSLHVAQSSTNPFNINSAARLLSQLYEPTDPRQALTYQKLAAVAKDSLIMAEKVRNFQNIEFNEQLRQEDVQRLEEAHRTRLLLYSLAGGVGVFMLMALLLYRYNRQQHRANVLLQQQQTETNVQRQKAETALTELTATQAQLIQQEKLASLGELTAGIAHEIQNPLNFVNNFAEVSTELIGELIDELPDAVKLPPSFVAELLTDLTQNLQKIHQNGQRASGIVRGMLEHSRTSSGERTSTNLNALAEEYLRLAYQGMRRLEGRTPGNPVKDKHLHTELVTDLDADLPQVAVVAPEIGRVLLNLFNNAFYAVQQKQKTAPATYQPTVSVSTRQIDHHIEIRVEDNGTGIPDTVKDKIFQPFFTTKPTGEGTGLGLSLAYDIITKGHGGTLTVESTAGEGTMFTVKLPTTTN